MAARKHSLFEKEIMIQAALDSFRKLNPVSLLKTGDLRDGSGSGSHNPWTFFPSGEEPFGLSCRWPSGCGSPCSLPILRKPWPKDGAKPRRRPFERRAPGPWPFGSNPMVQPTEWKPISCVRATSSSCPPEKSYRRTRDHRGCRDRGRVCHHRRIRTGHPGSGGRPKCGNRGTRVLSDWIKVRVTADPGESFLDHMIALVEGAHRRKTPNEIALTILLSALTGVFLVVIITLRPSGFTRGCHFRSRYWSHCLSA